jgi:hypothetical protein
MAPRALLLSVLLAVVAAVPAGASRVGPLVGVGEQKPGLFRSHDWHRLGLRQVRYVAPWDALDDPVQGPLLDAWMAAAHKAHAEVLLGFAHSLRTKRLAHKLPTVRQFAAQFARVRGRYPWVRNFLVWNEANNGHSLTGRKPRLVARYYNAVVRQCPSCRVIGADVLDTSNMVPWLKTFKRYAYPTPRIWGLHNYVDVNHFYTRGTLRLLKAVRGTIWFTGTGGVVLRRVWRGRKLVRTYRYGVGHAALATAQVFRLACLSPRITRVYLYHWQAPTPVTSWDSGLLDARGRPRPAFSALRRWVARSAQASRRGGRRALCRSTH